MWRRQECPWSRAVENAARGFTCVTVPRCEIRHDPDLDPFEVAMFGRACGAAVEAVERLLGVRLRRWWLRTGRVGVLLFASPDAVGRLYGSPCGGFAHYAAWYVAVNIQSGWAEDLRHEFAHLAASRWNPAPPTVLREGLAVWAQRTVGGQPVEHAVRHHAPGPRAALDLLLGAMPDHIVPRWSYYVVAGGFTAFLIRRFGWAAFLDLYQDRVATRENLPTRFARRLGVTVEAAVKMWYGELPRDPAPTVLQKRLLAA